MIVVGLDVETTGFKFDKGDRIVEACFSVYRVNVDGTFTHLRTIAHRINPERSIPEDAQAVHGIALEDLVGAFVWADIAPRVQALLDKTDLLVIHNAPFDRSFLYGEQARAGYPINREVATFCTMENSRWACPDGKLPKLVELCYALGIEYDGTKAHGAEYDVQIMMLAYQKAIQLGLFPNPLK